jgi:SOS-response transcriptional repressor LexA
MLTSKQATLLVAIEGLVERGIEPTNERIAEATGVQGRHGPSRGLALLAKRGFVGRKGRRKLVVLKSSASIYEGEPASDDPIALFVHEHQKANDGATPSTRAIMKAVGMNSTSRICRELERLHAQGAITWAEDDQGRMRNAIHVTKRGTLGSDEPSRCG